MLIILYSVHGFLEMKMERFQKTIYYLKTFVPLLILLCARAQYFCKYFLNYQMSDGHISTVLLTTTKYCRTCGHVRNKAEQLSQQRMFQSSLLKFSSTTANNGHRATVNLPKKEKQFKILPSQVSGELAVLWKKTTLHGPAYPTTLFFEWRTSDPWFVSPNTCKYLLGVGYFLAFLQRWPRHKMYWMNGTLVFQSLEFNVIGAMSFFWDVDLFILWLPPRFLERWLARW